MADAGVKRFYLLLGGLVLMGAAALGWQVLRRPPVSIPANVTVSTSDTSGFHGYFLGSDSAPLTVTEYADYQCPACQQWMSVQMPTIEERLIQTGRVRWRYRDFPLDGAHNWSRIAGHAAACAADQGQYWAMNRRIYSWEPDWTRSGDATGIFRGLARELGLKLDSYDDCMHSARYAGRLEASKGEGIRAGVSSTPTFLVNGRLYPGGESIHYDMLKALLDSLQGQSTR